MESYLANSQHCLGVVRFKVMNYRVYRVLNLDPESKHIMFHKKV